MKRTTPMDRAQFVLSTSVIMLYALLPFTDVDNYPTAKNAADSHPEIKRRADKVASNLDINDPDVAIWEMDVPNAFVLGDTQASTVVLSTALVDLLEEEEVEAVIAHELGHAKRGHTVKLTGLIVIGLVLTGAAYLPGCRRRGLVQSGLAAAVSSLLIFAFTRQSELVADVTGAKVIEEPANLANAIVKIDKAANVDADSHEADNRTLLQRLIATHPRADTRAEYVTQQTE